MKQATIKTLWTILLTSLLGGANVALAELQFENDIIVNETDGTATVTVTRTNGSTGIVSVDYNANFDSLTTPATNGSDFNLPAGTLTFADGVTSQTITFSIIDDSIFEGDEYFWIDLSNPTGGETLGYYWFMGVTITDGEDSGGGIATGQIQFPTSANVFVNETDGTATVTVARINGSIGTVTVDYFANQTFVIPAIINSDYKFTDGTLTFDSGVTSQTITFPIINDTVLEGTENFEIELRNPTGGATLGADRRVYVMIVDDEEGTPIDTDVISFESAIYNTNENDLTMTYTLIRTGNVNEVVSVDVTFEDGSALFGDDYNASSQSYTATFQDGESRITGTISIIDDSIAELEEMFMIRLNNPQGRATVGGVDGAIVTNKCVDYATSHSNYHAQI